MYAIHYLQEMIKYMERNGILHQYEYEIIEEEDDNREFFKFSFYDFESFFDFITQEFNCYTPFAYHYLNAWYSYGYCSPLCVLPDFMRNETIFVNMECVSKCVMVDNNEHQLHIDYDDIHAVNMNALRYKIVVWYEIMDEDMEQLVLAIRIPMICKECVLNTTKHVYYPEMLAKVEHLQQSIRLNCCVATDSIEKYTLCEPMLKRSILAFLKK